MDQRLTESGHGTGGLPSAPDLRDFKVGMAAAPFNWVGGYDIEEVLRMKMNSAAFSLPTKDQDGSYSCGGQAWSYLQEVLEALSTGNFEERSAKYIYSQTHVAGGGSDGRTNSSLVKSQGVSRETLCVSYENTLPPSEAFMERSGDISALARSDAATFEPKTYASVPLDFESLANAIKQNGGIALGVTGQNNGTWLSAFPKPPVNYDNRWAHWVYAGKCRTINGKKYIGIKNSWGNIAENGWQWLGEEYVPWMFEAWALTYTASVSVPFTRTLSYAMTGLDVVSLQNFLKAKGYLSSTISSTGYFGTFTAGAVKMWQVANNILDFQHQTDLTKIVFGPKSIALANTQL